MKGRPIMIFCCPVEAKFRVQLLQTNLQVLNEATVSQRRREKRTTVNTTVLDTISTHGNEIFDIFIESF